MKGLLPKPTLLELDEYNINQRIVEALTTVCSHAVLFSIVNEAKSAVKISKELQLSLSAVYKTLTQLEKLALVAIEKFEFSDEGKKIKQYRSKIESASISINGNKFEVSLKPLIIMGKEQF
jgi:predicted transcriptional regulator